VENRCGKHILNLLATEKPLRLSCLRCCWRRPKRFARVKQRRSGPGYFFPQIRIHNIRLMDQLIGKDRTRTLSFPITTMLPCSRGS
jgi:hypothetical protein